MDGRIRQFLSPRWSGYSWSRPFHDGGRFGFPLKPAVLEGKPDAPHPDQDGGMDFAVSIPPMGMVISGRGDWPSLAFHDFRLLPGVGYSWVTTVP